MNWFMKSQKNKHQCQRPWNKNWRGCWRNPATLSVSWWRRHWNHWGKIIKPNYFSFSYSSWFCSLNYSWLCQVSHQTILKLNFVFYRLENFLFCILDHADVNCIGCIIFHCEQKRSRLLETRLQLFTSAWKSSSSRNVCRLWSDPHESFEALRHLQSLCWAFRSPLSMDQ